MNTQTGTSDTRLHWATSPLGSVVHTVNRLRTGETTTNAALAKQLLPGVNEFSEWLRSSGLDETTCWAQLPAAACHATDIAHVARRVVTDLADGHRGPALARELEQHIQRWVKQFQLSVVDLDEQLLHRQRPLREQWNARGPGMLAWLDRQRTPHEPHDPITVFVVYPISGGAAGIHERHRSLWIEGVLANPMPELPEVVRLAWLVARVKYGVHDDGAAIDLLPAVLAAAEAVELATLSVATARQALISWQLCAADVDATAQHLLDSWTS